ncbi:MAG: recombination protein RecR [Phototrophicales bacterium]|nr:MAG: recombination protein RecR [Phototrophicales bacterium]
MPPSVANLIEAFSRLPGIGPKTASRLTFFLLKSPDHLSLSLAEALTNLKTKTKLCNICYNITESDVCTICASTKRDKTLIAVVEEPLDVLALERTGVYRGLYHVLHGVISPIEGIGPDDLKIKELLVRLQNQPDVLEIIIATNPNMEGEATAMYLKRQLEPMGLKITRLARGLPSGGDLEYVDAVTLLRAIEDRNEM